MIGNGENGVRSKTSVRTVNNLVKESQDEGLRLWLLVLPAQIKLICFLSLCFLVLLIKVIKKYSFSFKAESSFQKGFNEGSKNNFSFTTRTTIVALFNNDFGLKFRLSAQAMILHDFIFNVGFFNLTL